MDSNGGKSITLKAGKQKHQCLSISLSTRIPFFHFLHFSERLLRPTIFKKMPLFDVTKGSFVSKIIFPTR